MDKGVDYASLPWDDLPPDFKKYLVETCTKALEGHGDVTFSEAVDIIRNTMISVLEELQ